MTGAGESDGRTETHTLSTGHTVQVPLTLEARITGAVLSASLEGVRETLPDGLRPLKVMPGRGLVTFLSVDYQRVGDDAMEPYNELSMQIPAVETDESSIPVLSGLWRSTSGYVWYMPVTTEPAKALGQEVWGYPKDVAEISIDHGGSRTQTTITVDGDHLLTMDITRPPTAPLRLTGYSYTELDGRLVREKTALKGEIGGWPVSEKVAIELGDHPRSQRLRDLALGNKAVLRIAADCTFKIYRGETRRY